MGTTAENTMYRHILVPTDGSPLSLKAAKEATKLAKSQKARITAYYAIAPFRLPATGEALIVTPELYSEKEYSQRPSSSMSLLMKSK
jgi:nucleotide-binding universal stress UspA family protein